MNHVIHRRVSLAFASLVLVVLSTSFASDSRAQEPKPRPEPERPQVDLEALKQRMKGRYKLLSDSRDEGTIGETAEGMIAFRDPASAKRPIPKKPDEKGEDKDRDKDDDKKEKPAEGTLGDVVDAENADRKVLYEVLAKQLKTTPAKIGIQNGLRNLERAEPDHWFRLADGKWAQRKSIVRKKPEKD
ncbi:MAG: DUF1318 domain-containing protein [Planctomycetes bacterium]|nr:DUF1318 domain-containing protein [Planctomycetota bacterium]MCB9892085.1 DUF1318 domain-containing protein [Planctomycetota bacterium]MCB9920343.1 DUF1318 domain-containing protein [Planctomycetota bacterium]